ncbi:N-acetyltransferase [Sphingobacteriales bacterium UPWRP_1]|nr:GNAT family N-acetyltransferase [Sphingobacteriales bacterium TSM_CSM]PSJ72862.1 N-acetyltransferase [Sphingobacteriales bacterium UPWRP_1]
MCHPTYPFTEVTNGSYTISTNKLRLQICTIYHFLSNHSYWAKNIPLETVQQSIDHSLCFGVYYHAKQVGFARVITDFATFAYLADVFILPPFRGLGLSKWLMQVIFQHPPLQQLRRWMLATADAQTLYAQYGFTPLANPGRIMEKHNPLVYQPEAQQQPL